MSEDTNEQVDIKRVGSSIAGYPAALPLDVSEYMVYVQDFDISEEQKIELLQTLWNIMAAMVDLSWGVDSVQRLLPAFNEALLQEAADGLQPIENPTEDFNKTADGVEKGSKP